MSEMRTSGIPRPEELRERADAPNRWLAHQSSSHCILYCLSPANTGPSPWATSAQRDPGSEADVDTSEWVTGPVRVTSVPSWKA